MRRSVVEIAYSNSLLRDRTLVPHWRSPFDMISKGPDVEGWSGRTALTGSAGKTAPADRPYLEGAQQEANWLLSRVELAKLYLPRNVRPKRILNFQPAPSYSKSS